MLRLGGRGRCIECKYKSNIDPHRRDNTGRMQMLMRHFKRMGCIAWDWRMAVWFIVSAG